MIIILQIEYNWVFCNYLSILDKSINISTKKPNKNETLTKERKEEVTWRQMPEVIILGIYWKRFSIGANLTSAIAIRPSFCTNSKHPNCVLGDYHIVPIL